MVGYYENCTFHAVFRDNAGNISTRLVYVIEPMDSPAGFYNWVKVHHDELIEKTGGGVAILEAKIIQPVISTMWEEFKN